MFQMTKKCSILAAFLFCTMVFVACSNSVSFTDLQDIAEPQASQEDADKIATVSQTDGTDSTAVQDTTQADTAAIGDSVKTGINSSLSPGVKIGVRATIGSGVLLYEDLESDMRVLVKQEHIFQNKKETGQISLEEAEENKEE